MFMRTITNKVNYIIQILCIPKLNDQKLILEQNVRPRKWWK